jgi:hypothetical protein
MDSEELLRYISRVNYERGAYAEREACALLAETWETWKPRGKNRLTIEKHIAAAIRARRTP